ncbi:hypothetical protein HZB00_03320 [Candidatus Woesearchaeota archaeon]|nr:hypothetical protein [Candidatus Woesearchaeota archaeon]
MQGGADRKIQSIIEDRGRAGKESEVREILNMGFFSLPKKQSLSKEDLEQIESLGIFLTDIQKLQKERKELAILFYAPFQEKELKPEIYHDISSSKQAEKTLEMVIANIKSNIAVAKEMRDIKEVSAVVNILQRELLSFEVVYNMFYVTSKLKTQNLRKNLKEIMKAVMEEEKALKALETKIVTLSG